MSVASDKIFLILCRLLSGMIFWLKEAQFTLAPLRGYYPTYWQLITELIIFSTHLSSTFKSKFDCYNLYNNHIWELLVLDSSSHPKWTIRDWVYLTYFYGFNSLSFAGYHIFGLLSSKGSLKILFKDFLKSVSNI